MLVARKASNIQADITRNWSSWNFGEDGLEMSIDELANSLANDIDYENGTEISISGFDIYLDNSTQITIEFDVIFIKNDSQTFELRELYDNYIVLVDRVNGNGLAGINLISNDLSSALAEIECASFFGDGNFFDAQSAVLIYSDLENEIHIFEVNEN